MIPVIVTGACGRMGKSILNCAAESCDFNIVGAVEFPGNPAIGKSVSEACGISGVDMLITDFLPIIEGEKPVIIEFTSPDATMEHLEFARDNGCPIIIGTTAMNEDQVKKINEAAVEISVVFASNTSVGVNLLFKLVEEAAKILGSSYDVEIFESHHRFKKDAPSGTAKTLSEKICGALNLDPAKSPVYGRSGITGERKKDEIGIHAMRGGDIVGEHTVYFVTLGERLELTHRCHSRNTFALGALRAAKFLHDAGPGLYNMQDVLGIN
jgi:4-hydroxy-tetrahydrodipicolinate reductase